MYTNQWINQLSESYVNITNNTNTISLTEEEMHFVNLAIIVESIEETFDITLTEEEIQQIEEEIQLNEFVVPLFKIGVQAAKKGISKGMQKAGKKLINQPAYNKARQEAIKKADDDYAKAIDAWKKGGEVGDIPAPIKPVMPKRGTAAKVGTWMVKKAPTAPKSIVKAAGYGGVGAAAWRGVKDVWNAASTLATGRWPKEPKDKSRRGPSGAIDHSTGEASDYDPAKREVTRMTPRGELPGGGGSLVGSPRKPSGPPSSSMSTVPPEKRGGGGASSQADEIAAGRRKLLSTRPVGFSRRDVPRLPPAITDSVLYLVKTRYLSEMTKCAANSIETIYDVQLTENDLYELSYSIGKKII